MQLLVRSDMQLLVRSLTERTRFLEQIRDEGQRPVSVLLGVGRLLRGGLLHRKIDFDRGAWRHPDMLRLRHLVAIFVPARTHFVAVLTGCERWGLVGTNRS